MQVPHRPDVSTEQLLSPVGEAWLSSNNESLTLTGTPLAMQPSSFVQAKWADKTIGAIKNVRVASIHNGQSLAFRLQWNDDTNNVDNQDNVVFPDAAAIALPINENSPLMTMGAPGAGLNAWYWRADNEEGHQVLLEGPGSSQFTNTGEVRVASQWADGVWSVVIARPMSSADSTSALALKPGMSSKFAVAVWEGGAGERGGLKAYSPEWIELDLAG